MQELLQSPMLYLSSGSKELFHSNFLFWLGNAYRELFEELLSRLCHINRPWPENWTLRREYKHLDLCITYAKATGKTIKGKAVVKECAFIVLENKVKSLPDMMQLRRYEQVFAGQGYGCTYMVLSLVKDFPGCKYLEENTIWQVHHYDELGQLIEECYADDCISEQFRPYIRDYCQYVSKLSALAEGWKIDEQEPFLVQHKDLQELRLNDLYEKVRYAQIATMLADKLKPMLKQEKEVETVVLGMSNTDVILRRRRRDADEILTFWGCPEAKPYGQVFIGSGMSHAVGLVEAKVKVSEDCCLVVQVQGNRYCHCIECDDIANKQENLSDIQNNFLEFNQGGLKDNHCKPGKKICRYNTGFIYKLQKIQPTHTVENIVDAIVADLIEIKSRNNHSN